MSTGAGAAPTPPQWGLWSQQALAVLRIELRKVFWGKRSFALYLLCLGPLLLLAGRAFVLWRGWVREDPAAAAVFYANIYQSFVLRFVLFFGCAWIFTNLFRGEILDRTLHFYFLSPIRREVLVVAKFCSGLIAAVTFFGATTAATLVLLYAPYGASTAVERVLGGSGIGTSVAYLGVTALGCLGYGAVFLATGLLVRNPMIPAVAILGWESINFLLPPLLKKLSVIYYLVSLCPIPISQGPIALMADPTPAWISVPGLLALTLGVLLVARWRIRDAEISYGTD